MSTDRIKRWVRPSVQSMVAYHIPDASGALKLDAMENPYCLPVGIEEAWLDEMKGVEINRYPDPATREALTVELRRQSGIGEDTGLLLGNGSDEIILMLALVFSGQSGGVLVPEPGFGMCRIIAAMSGLDYHAVALNKNDFSLQMGEMRKAIAQYQPGIVFIANPNNPTGNIHSMDELRELARVCPGVLVIDEAYAPFTDMTATGLLDEFEHVLVMRTVSKMGLAGLRLGYLLGSPDWIREIDKARLPYNINILTLRAAIFMLRHKAVFDEQAILVRKTRERLLNALLSLPGVEKAWPSEANFVLARVASGRVISIFEQLQSQGVLVRCLHGSHELLCDCLRITVGSEQENTRFLQILSEILAVDAVQG